MMDIIAYADGAKDVLDIADILGEKMWDVFEIIKKLAQNGIVSLYE